MTNIGKKNRVTILGYGEEKLDKVEFNTFKETIDEKIAEATDSNEVIGSINSKVADLETLKIDKTTFDTFSTSVDQKVETVTTQLAETVKIQSQADYVSLVESLTNYKKLFFRKVSPNNYSIFAHNGTQHASYNIMKDENDDFLKIGECFVGLVTKSTYTRDVPTFAGTFLNSGEQYYTTTINDSFTARVKGETIVFRTYKDNRGGVWRFIIEGEQRYTMDVSTYSSATGALTTLNLLTGLNPNIEHKITATFLGADPNNPPTGGTARGWLIVPTSTTTGTIIGQVDFNNPNTNLLLKNSNKEMGFHFTKVNESNWVPDHGVGTAFNKTSPVFIIDGQAKDVTSMTNNEIIDCTDIKIVQDMKAKFPVAGDIAEYKITYSFGKNGIASIAGTWTAKQDVTFDVGYPLMLPGDAVYLNEVVTSFGNSKTNALDESDYYFQEEKDKAFSGALINSSRPNIIACATVEYPLKTLRIGKDRKDIEKSLRFWQRSTTPKLYFTNFEKGTLKSGETFSWYGKIAVAQIDNIYNYVKQ